MSWNGTVTTNTLPLRIRSGPSISSSQVGSIPKGAKVVVTELSEPGGGWIWGRVTYNGVSGWSCVKEPGVGQWITLEEIKEPAPVPPPPAPDPPKKDEDLSSFIDKLMGGNQLAQAIKLAAPIVGAAVQYGDERFKATGEEGADSYASGGSVRTTQKPIIVNDTNEPRYIQNATGFPYNKGMQNGLNVYDYYMDYSGINSDMENLYNNLNLNPRNRRELYLSYTQKYNRFKVANPNDQLHKSFAHVFFIRPDLNILDNKGGGVFEISKTLENDASTYYACQHSPELLKSLIHGSGENHDFLMYLSNKANSLEISDEYITTDSYGNGYTGYKIPYGKHNVESKTAGTINVSYQDDRDLHVYHLHKIWTDYISGVYRGQIKSKDEYVKNKIIDYASAIYYILTAEDGETVIFWSKYYGVFPTNSPSSVTSFSKGNLLKVPEFTVTYSYTFKEDFNPLTLVEFNKHSAKNSYRYLKTYESSLLGTGRSFVGAPFIETFNGSLDVPYTFKIRFRP